MPRGSPPELVEGRAEPARAGDLFALHARHRLRAAGGVAVGFARARDQRGRAGQHSGCGAPGLRGADKRHPPAPQVGNRVAIGRDWPARRQADPSTGSGGGCGCSTTPTAPSSRSSRRAASAWWRLFSAISGPTYGCPTGLARRWAGPAKIRSASPTSSATCNIASRRATRFSPPTSATCWQEPAGSGDDENGSPTPR